MALKDQPFLPLYIEDLMTDEKLVECSAATHGVYMRLICILHKEAVYGKAKLKEKYKTESTVLGNFAEQFSKNMPFKTPVILSGLVELLKEDVIQLRGNVLSQKRMVKDGELSEKRSKSGKAGGAKTSEINKKNAITFAKANQTANSVNDIVIDNVSEDIIEEVGDACEQKKYVRDVKLESDMLSYFGFSEIANPDKQSAIFQFCTCLHHSDRLDHFKVQFAAYVELKAITGYKHSFQKFIGDQSELFVNGAWNAENWTLKLVEEKSKSKILVDSPKRKVNLPDDWSLGFYTTHKANKKITQDYFNHLISKGYHQTTDRLGHLYFKKSSP